MSLAKKLAKKEALDANKSMAPPFSKAISLAQTRRLN